ncbi:ERF family protein [Paenibacillus sp. 1P03SA]|uniref:ERF family protein n=1 Tax=Paenibacillus sp. 1P03SA TaxID=3132294 RepID=UPI0039A2327A
MNNKASLYKKIHAVMQDVGYLQKDDKVSFGNTNYKAISEEKVTSTVREALVNHGLIIIPCEQDHKKDGSLTTVDVKYKIIDIDTGEFEFIVSSGTGADTQDKGVGKAMTYSYKYLLLRTFAIPTGEDPDKISSAELDHREKQTPKPPTKPPEAPKDSAGVNATPTIKAKYKIIHNGSLDGLEEFLRNNGAETEKVLTEILMERTKKGA